MPPLDDARAAAARAQAFLEPAAPYAAQAAASAAAFTVGMAATQAFCFAIRLSCATPVLAPLAGAVGVGVSSALAGQASLRVRAATRADGRDPPPRAWRRQDVACDALLGIVLFRAMGGRYRSLLPSDLVKPGACAVESLPAPGSAYAQGVSKGELARLMRRDGCHHCGTRHGRVIGDHIPPNKFVHGGAAAPRPSPPPSLGRAPVVAAAQFLSTAARSQPRGGFYRPGATGGTAGGAVAAALDLTWTLATCAARAVVGVGPPRPRPRPRLGRAVRQWVARTRLTLAWRAKEALGLNPTRQRYFPQCRPCSLLQAAAVRTGKTTLKMHAGGAKPAHYAGPLVGLRHYREPAAGSAWDKDRKAWARRAGPVERAARRGLDDDVLVELAAGAEGAVRGAVDAARKAL